MQERLGARAGHGPSPLVLLPLLLTALVYRTLIDNYFTLDDFAHLFQIADDDPLAFLLTPYLGHAYVTRNAVFYLMFQLFGTHAAYYFWVALLTHLVNVWLAFHVIRELTDNQYLAAFGAALWGTSPLNEGSLGYYSVFGHVLVATAILIILLQAVRAARCGRPPGRATVLWWYALALAAMTSFGTGLALAVALPFALLCFLPPPVRPPGARLPLGPLLVVAPALYVGLQWVYVHGLGRPIFLQTNYALLLSDWPGVLVFAVRLVAMGVTRLVFGNFFPDWMGPWSWYAVTALVGAGWVWAARATPALRRPLIGCALLALACYASIVAGRGMVFARVPLEMFLTLSRYHYVGQLMLTLLICLALRPAADALGTVAQAALLAAWCAVSLSVYACCATEIDHNLESRTEVERELAVIRSAIDAQPPGADVRIENRRLDLYPFWAAFPGRAGLFTIFFPDNTVDGRRVYFVEPSAVLLRQAPRRRRTATLFVSK